MGIPMGIERKRNQNEQTNACTIQFIIEQKYPKMMIESIPINMIKYNWLGSIQKLEVKKIIINLV